MSARKETIVGGMFCDDPVPTLALVIVMLVVALRVLIDPPRYAEPEPDPPAEPPPLAFTT